MQRIERQRQQDSPGTPSRRESDRELLTALAGADVAEKLTDAQIARLYASISRVMAAMRQQDFNAGFSAGIDHTVDCVGALCAQNAKSH